MGLQVVFLLDDREFTKLQEKAEREYEAERIAEEEARKAEERRKEEEHRKMFEHDYAIFKAWKAKQKDLAHGYYRLPGCQLAFKI